MRTGICSICSRPDADAIDQALVEGGTSRGVAQRFGLAKSSVSRHRANDLRKRLQAAAKERGGAPGDHLLEEMENLNAIATKILAKAMKAKEHAVALAAIREARQTLMDQARLLGQLGGGDTTINIFGDPEAALRMAIAELQRRGYRVLSPGQGAIEAVAVSALPALADRGSEGQESEGQES